MHPTKFQVNWPFGSGMILAISDLPIGTILAIFDSHDGHLGFPIGTSLPIFDLQVTPMLPTEF